MAATLARELTVRELARERGVSTRTIRRWLHRLNARTGGKTIYRDGDGPTSPIKTTLRALREANPRLVETRDLEVERIAVELRRVNGARIRATVQSAIRELAGDVEDRLKSLESQGAKVVELVQLALPLGQIKTNLDTKTPLSK